MSASPTITVNNMTLAHSVIGEGFPVLMLHGWGANRTLVTPLADKLALQGFQCFVPDLPAFGDSPEPPTAWTVFDYATCVLGYMKQLQLERVHLFGHSFGGRLSLILAADHPHLISKVVLADSAGIRPKTPFSIQFRTRLYKGVRNALDTVGLKPLSEQLRSAYNQRYGSADFNAVSGVMRQTFINVINQDLLSYAARIPHPTLLFWGDQDQDTPLWMGQTFEKTIPDAALIVHQGAGHYSYLDRLSETAHVMGHFFKN
jgi:pimeloyl-ACP methyl ester carboxylesterase